jgi:hypothetical protein
LIEGKLRALEVSSQRAACAAALGEAKAEEVKPSTEAAIVEATKVVAVNSGDASAFLCRARAWVTRAEALDGPRHEAHLKCKSLPGLVHDYSGCMGVESLRYDRTSPTASPTESEIKSAQTGYSVLRLLGLLIESVKTDEAVFMADTDIERAVQAKANPREVAPLRARLSALKVQMAEK